MPALTPPPTSGAPSASLRRRALLPVALVAVVAVLAACGSAAAPSSSAGSSPTAAPETDAPATAAPTAPPPTPVLAGDGPLVTFRAHGGHCRTGTCEFNAEIYADGRVNRSDGMEQVVDPMSLGLLTRGIEAADWEAILAVPFTGECPVNFDGQEQVYTFHVTPEPVVIASCTTEIDPSEEPFQTVQGILFGVGG